MIFFFVSGWQPASWQTSGFPVGAQIVTATGWPTPNHRDREGSDIMRPGLARGCDGTIIAVALRASDACQEPLNHRERRRRQRRGQHAATKQHLNLSQRASCSGVGGAQASIAPALCSPSLLLQKQCLMWTCFPKLRQLVVVTMPLFLGHQKTHTGPWQMEIMHRRPDL